MFNLSLRSVFGMNGLHADGQKATGFKSMVVAQFTGIGLQKDDNAFLLYNSTTGVYDDATVPGNENLSTNSRAIFKPTYTNQPIVISILNVVIIQLYRQFRYLRLVLQNTLLLKLVVICQSPTQTLTLVQEH